MTRTQFPARRRTDRRETLKLFTVMQVLPLTFLAIAIVSALLGDAEASQNGLEFFAFFFLVGLLVSPMILYLDAHNLTP